MSQSRTEGDTAKLTIRFSLNRAAPDQEFDLEITMRNMSQGALYLCGAIDLEDASAFCNYTLQVRRKGESAFQEPIVKSAADGLRPRWAELSLSQFKEQANAFLLHPDHSLSIVTRTKWARFITKSPGLHEVRVLYNSRIPLPVSLDRPFLQERLTSNLVEIEIVR